MTERYRIFSLLVEFVGVIGVILSLVFVGVQIKQANNLARSNSYQNINASFNQSMEVVFTNENLFKVWFKTKGLPTAGLSPGETARLAFIWREIFRTYDSAFFAYKYSTLGEKEWGRMKRKICTNYNRMGVEMWSKVKTNISQSFKDYVEKRCGIKHRISQHWMRP